MLAGFAVRFTCCLLFGTVLVACWFYLWFVYLRFAFMLFGCDWFVVAGGWLVAGLDGCGYTW